MFLHDVLRGSTCGVQFAIEDSRAVGVPFGEETVTDLLLRALAKHPDHCVVRKYSRYQEHRVGADFLLAVVSDTPNGREAMVFLVQAKILYENGRYGALHRVSHAHPQTATLLTVAGRNHFVPLFAFYNSAPSPRPSWADPLLPSACPRVVVACPHMTTFPRDEGDLGVTLARADSVDEVVEAVGSSPSVEALRDVTWALPCLTYCYCVAEAGGYGPPIGADDENADTSYGASLVERVRARLEHDAPPIWPSGDELGTRTVPEWLDLVLRNPSENIDRILVRQLDEIGASALVLISDAEPIETADG